MGNRIAQVVMTVYLYQYNIGTQFFLCLVGWLEN